MALFPLYINNLWNLYFYMVETKALEKSHQISDFLQIYDSKEQKSMNLKNVSDFWFSTNP